MYMVNIRDKALFLLRISPLTVYQFAVGGVIFTRERVFVLFLLGLIGSELINNGLKLIIREPRPSCECRVNEIATGCSCIPEYGKVSESYGMPSGHAQLWGYTAAFWAVYLISKEKPHATAHSMLLFIVATLVAWSRVEMLCHSVRQVTVGFLIGVAIALLQSWWFSPG